MITEKTKEENKVKVRRRNWRRSRKYKFSLEGHVTRLVEEIMSASGDGTKTFNLPLIISMIIAIKNICFLYYLIVSIRTQRQQLF